MFPPKATFFGMKNGIAKKWGGTDFLGIAGNVLTSLSPHALRVEGGGGLRE